PPPASGVTGSRRPVGLERGGEASLNPLGLFPTALPRRGVHDMRPVEQQLDYQIKYRDVRAGMKEYADRYCEYLIAQGKTAAKGVW
ncbi:MAG: hypothetical protein L0338_26325, partial [Acidobacteria bacterium]|nr:hypothetical protein [Acidobacteriota bacterium]